MCNCFGETIGGKEVKEVRMVGWLVQVCGEVIQLEVEVGEKDNQPDAKALNE